MSAAPHSQRRAPDHALRRPDRRQRAVLRPPAATDITAVIGPNGAGKTTRVQLHHRLLPADVGTASRCTHPDGAAFDAASGCPATASPARARVARTFQNIRLFAGMTVLENLLVAQHNTLMRASGFTVLGGARPAGIRRAPNAGRRQGALLARPRRSASNAPTIPPARCPTARSGGSRSRARCAPTRCCFASTSRPPASTARERRTERIAAARSATSTAPRSC